MPQYKYRIPFNKLGEDPLQALDEIYAASNVIRSGEYILGPKVQAFESYLSSYYGAYAVGVGSGTDALEILLRIAKKPNKPLVITVGNAGRPPLSAIQRAGLTPIVADVDSRGLMAVSSLRNLLAVHQGQVSAVMPVHLYGQRANMDKIQSMARLFDVDVIEDGAQVFGSTSQGPIGSLGMGLSFYPTKALGALGDGGAIITQDLEVAQKARAIRTYNGTNNYDFGVNSRLDEIQAAILLSRFQPSLYALKHRRKLAKRYCELIRPSLQHRTFNECENYHLFTVYVPNRDKVKEYMAGCGIGTAIHYPMIYDAPELIPMTYSLCNHVLSLPLYNTMSEHHVEEVVGTLHEAIDATA